MVVPPPATAQMCSPACRVTGPGRRMCDTIDGATGTARTCHAETGKSGEHQPRALIGHSQVSRRSASLGTPCRLVI
jgi:hypothetical protein